MLCTPRLMDLLPVAVLTPPARLRVAVVLEEQRLDPLGILAVDDTPTMLALDAVTALGTGMVC